MDGRFRRLQLITRSVFLTSGNIVAGDQPDGRLDAATSNIGGTRAASTMAAALDPAPNYTMSAEPEGATVGDGRWQYLTLAVASYRLHGVFILLGDGNGGIAAQQNLAVGDYSYNVAAADFS